MPGIVRAGLGYRGRWHRQGIVLQLTRVHRARQELTGLLVVQVEGRSLFRGKFNASSLTTRRTLVTHLKEHTGGYSGWVQIVEQFCERVDELDEEGTPVVRFVDLAPPRAADYRLDPLIPRGFATLLYGPGGAMKSTLAAGIAVSVATGIEVMGWIPHPGPVLILDWESGPDEWYRRLEAIGKGIGVTLPPDIHYRRCENSLADMAEGLSAWVREHEVALVVIDSVGMATGAGHDGGDASETAIRLFKALRDIGTTALLIDHVTGESVGNATTGTARPYGSVYKINLARSCWELRKEERPGEDGTQLLLKHRKVNEGKLQHDIGLRVDHGEGCIGFGRCEVSAPDLESHAGTTADQMARVLGREGALTVNDLAEHLSKSPAVIRVQLQRNRQRFIRMGEKVGLLGTGYTR